jgi:hypothetical protein
MSIISMEWPGIELGTSEHLVIVLCSNRRVQIYIKLPHFLLVMSEKGDFPTDTIGI